jgi:hypothetical protein
VGVRGLLRTVTAAGVIGLVAAGQAAATAVHWNESATIDHAQVMQYSVDSLTVGKTNWSAEVSFKNDSSKTLKVGEQFGLAFYSDRSTQALTKAVGRAYATEASSAVPKTLKPGASWSGTIGGTGKLNLTGTVYTRVIFGPFTGLPGEKAPVVWITNHELPVSPPGNVA